MSTDALIREQLPRFVKKTRDEKQWWSDFLSSLAQQAGEALPPVQMAKGLQEGDVGKFGRGFGESAAMFAPVGGGIKAVEKGASKIAEEALPKLAKKAKGLIEGAGGKFIKQIEDKLHWIDASGEKKVFDLSGRVGPRQVGTNPRLTGDSLRQVNESPRQLAATDVSGASPEELSRNGVFYKVGRTGEPTYLGKSVDAPVKSGEAIINVQPGKMPSIYQGSGKQGALDKFNQSATGQDIINRLRSQRGAVGPSDIPPKSVRNKTITSQAVPEFTVPPRFKLGNKGPNGQSISFANNFDKAAYHLANAKKPNSDLLAELQVQSGLDENTILQHGTKIKQRIDELTASGQPIKLKPRSISVVGEAKPESWAKTLIGTPSAMRFSIDLPALRQSFQPTVFHPIKSGLPALKRAFGSITEKGFRENVADLANTSPLHDLLEQATAMGPSKAEAMFPNIREFQKLGVSDVPEYFTGTNRLRATPIGKYLTNPSERMYEMYQSTIRGKELDRLAEKTGKSVFDLAKDETMGPEVGNIMRRINEETGRGPLGKLEPAANVLSTAFTAPRNTSAKLQRVNPLNYFPSDWLKKIPGIGDKIVESGLGGRYGSDVAYKDFMTDRAKMAALLGGGAVAAKELGGDVETNPLATNFGVRFGNWKPDLTGGELTLPRFAPRPFTEERISAKGLPYGYNPEMGRNKRTENRAGDIGRFFRSQLRPGLPSMSADWFKGTNYIGEDIKKPYIGSEEFGLDIPYSRWVSQQFMPSYPSDVYDAATTGDPFTAMLAAPTGILGMGSNTYDPFAYNPYKLQDDYITVPKHGKSGGKSNVGRTIIR